MCACDVCLQTRVAKLSVNVSNSQKFLVAHTHKLRRNTALKIIN